MPNKDLIRWDVERELTAEEEAICARCTRWTFFDWMVMRPLLRPIGNSQGQ